MNPARDFGPKLMTFLAGWDEVAFTGGRDIPYFLIPIFAPILGACLGAAGYRALIARHLPRAVSAVETVAVKTLTLFRAKPRFHLESRASAFNFTH